MIDIGHLPAKIRQKIYVGTEVSGTPPIQIDIPLEATFVFFSVIGGGGGGGRPNPAAATSGGGGGGAGPVTHGLFLAKELPRKLYANISRRGAGATTSNTNGGNGLGTYLSAIYSTTPNARDVFLMSRGGSGGNAAGGGGAGGAASTIADMALASSALWVVSGVGQAGANSSATNGGSISIATSTFCSGGAAGGGSTGGNGGGQTSASALYPSLPTSAGAGLSGYIIERPFICIGGCGGRGTNGATGSAGGNGAYIGAGGGGGGNGTTTSGNGGNGGSGAIIMRWW